MNNEQVSHYVKSLGKLVFHVGEYFKALGEKAEIERQNQCLEKIQKQLDQLQQQTVYILSNRSQEH